MKVDRIADRLACEDVLTRYCRALDWLDEEALRSCFWPDATIDYGFYKGDFEGFAPVVMQVERSTPRRFHVSTNTTYAFDGDACEAESYAITHAMAPHDDGSMRASTFFGRYLDRLEKREGAWRIAKRRYMLHGSETASANPDEALGPMTVSKDLNPADPLYRKLI